jgi:hypothetical protein
MYNENLAGKSRRVFLCKTDFNFPRPLGGNSDVSRKKAQRRGGLRGFPSINQLSPFFKFSKMICKETDQTNNKF